MNILNSTTSGSRAERFLETLRPYDDLIVMMHDNPDPDAIAAGWAIQTIIAECLGREARLVGGGAIVRAENRHFVEKLHPPIELVTDLDVGRPSGVIFVDCNPIALNHMPCGGVLIPLALIDHHPASRVSDEVIPFQDVRTQVAATASLVTSYLWKLKLEPPENLATALLYAIRTETQGFETAHSRLDRLAIRWLTSWANPEWIAEIQSAPLSRVYYGEITMALLSASMYGDTAFCLLPQAEGAEVVGEVADLLIRCEGLERVMCAATVKGEVLLSVRTAEGGGDAGELARLLLEGLGNGGGHGHRAGGKIPKAAVVPILPTLDTELRGRWLNVCHVKNGEGTPLISRREILENLSS